MPGIIGVGNSIPPEPTLAQAIESALNSNPPPIDAPPISQPEPRDSDITPQQLPPSYQQTQQTRTKVVPVPQPQLQIPTSSNVLLITQNVPVTPLNQLGETSQQIECPFCGRLAMTIVRKEDSPTTNVLALLCCLVCICLTCVPSLMGMAQDTNYCCSKCHKRVAYRRHGRPLQVNGPVVSGETLSRYAP